MTGKTIAAVAAAALIGVTGHALAGAEKITFPNDYKSNFTHFMTSDRADNNQVRDLYANPIALESARDGAPLDHGAQFVMEVYGAKVDDNGEPILDADGRFQKDAIKVIAVMQKGEGWGDAYPEDMRNGDWEYGFFTPAGELKADVDTAPCRECHFPYAEDDYVIYFENLVERATQ